MPPTTKDASISAEANTKIKIRITAVMDQEFKRRGVFQELRPETAIRIIAGSTSIHMVSIERAREILADAKAHRDNGDLPRGLPVAYGSIISHINDALKEEARRGVLGDPGMAEVQRRQAASSACFQVGDHVLFFNGDDEYGKEATIVEGYRMYQVADDDGPYITRDDNRFRYSNGYVISRKGSDHCFFASAFSLTRDDCKPSHLHLVVAPSVSGISAKRPEQRQGASA